MKEKNPLQRTETEQDARHDENIREAREKNGQCPSCGQQLFRLKPAQDELSCCCLSMCFGKKHNGQGEPVTKIPLTIPQLVNRGQCMNCMARRLSNATEISTLSSDSSHLGENADSSTTRAHSLRSLPTNEEMHSPTKEEMHREGSTRGSHERSFWETNMNSESESPGLDPSFVTSTKAPPPKIHASATGKLPSSAHSVPTYPASTTGPSSCTAVYHGPYNEFGEKHGEGTMIWSNGDVYKGTFINDNREGSGTLTFATTDPSLADGGEYVGDWVCNMMHGNGTRRYPNGDVYMGGYEFGKRHGQGRFYYSNGDMYCGSWQDNQMQGQGRYYYACGQRFEGTFAHGKRNGLGKLQRTDGTLEVFQYLNDERIGQGVRWSKDRTTAWRMWMPMKQRVSHSNSMVTNALEKQKITIAEAMSLVCEIEQAATLSYQAMLSIRLN